jgi:ABC-type multidrug transport system fused ATPase/permease subunit
MELEQGLCVEDIEDEISGYIEKISADIGYYWWKRYIYAAFWSNISTPINLSIVMLTTLTTGQAATQSLLSKEVTTILGSVVLFVSIFNSFFKPYEQLTQNQQILQQWTAIGDDFDEIYYDRVYTREEKLIRLANLEKLFKSMSALKRMNDNNYCIDLLFILIRMICIRKNITWVQIKEDNAKKRRQTILTNIVIRQPNMLDETIV